MKERFWELVGKQKEVSLMKQLIVLNLKSILGIRLYLSKLLTNEEWENKFKALIGPNVLTELRAYGAISNFLLPALAHYVLKDADGRPLTKNSLIVVHEPLPEKEMLQRDLLERFGTAEQIDTEPKNYIDKYDENYKKIIQANDVLLKKLEKEKIKLFKDYNLNKANKKDIKYTLEAVSLLESRLIDLKRKVKERHDYIVRNNTYRAPLE